MASNTTPLQPDDNLVNGQTYTFQFKCANWILCPSDATLLADLQAQAPDFITSPMVTDVLGSLYNVQFTYEGDGSDVVSDVANSIMAAVLAASNDNLTFVGAVAAAASQIAVSPVQAVQTVAAGAQAAATSVTGAIVNTAGSTLQSATSQTLTAILPILIVVVLIVLFVLPSFAKSAGELKS